MSLAGQIYIPDTSSLIECARHYPRAIFPTVWNNLTTLVESEVLLIHEMVRLEIEPKADDLREWTTSCTNYITPMEAELEPYVFSVMSEFDYLVKPTDSVGVADPFVVAFAFQLRDKIDSTLRIVVVTQESQEPEKRKIPSACKSRKGIEAMGLLELMKREGWQI